MATEPVEPLEVAERVERYVDRELTDARKYDNRAPLDDSGVWSLHRLAAEIYALGFDAGEMVAGIRHRGERQRAEERSDDKSDLGQETP
jgi:hypothetical protein